jgi:hypothetical protein
LRFSKANENVLELHEKKESNSDLQDKFDVNQFSDDFEPAENLILKELKPI